MSESSTRPDRGPSAGETTYLNPVYRASCPDPFVLKFRGEYWCYSTGFSGDSRVFGVLHSRDLVNWRALGGAMEALPGGHTCYWAPEVWCENGRFLMYYSVGNEERMQIRVAVAERPEGPFVDSGRALTKEEFAIDAHLFEDDDGARWLFYATDFLTHTHVGTGTVRDRMLDAFTLEGKPQPVTRARYDWQVYDPQRASKGGVRWHTVEGPSVLKRKGRYYEMFSGGNWQQETYGVSYAVTDDIGRGEEWEQAADGARVLPILRTIPGEVIGPGHNSVVRGPDNRQLFCVYHRWDREINERVLAIDRLDWAGERMLVVGPSTAPQPAPNAPTFADYFDAERENGLGGGWECAGGRWSVRGNAAVQSAVGSVAEARCAVQSPCFVAEVSLRGTGAGQGSGGFGVTLGGAPGALLRFMIKPSTSQAVVICGGADGGDGGGKPAEEKIALPAAFDANQFHLLRVEADEERVKLALDGAAVKWAGKLDDAVTSLALSTDRAAAEFSGFALTVGWEDLFTGGGEYPEEAGWHTPEANHCWRVGEGRLWCASMHGERSLIAKGPLLADYEFVVSAALMDEVSDGEGYGFAPALDENWAGPLLLLRRTNAGWALVVDGDAGGAEGARAFSLPLDFDPGRFQHFRFRKRQGRLTIQHEAQPLGEIEVAPRPTRVACGAHKIVASFGEARVTALS